MSKRTREDELLQWIGQHAPLAGLCQRGGWPDESSLSLLRLQQEGGILLADVCFDEVVLDMSECEPTRSTRCGRFAIACDGGGRPRAIRLLYPM